MRVMTIGDAEPGPRRVAVGEFDGVHLGHRAVITGNDTVVTFEPHPATILTPQAAPKLITGLDVKTDLIEALGVAELVVVPFDLDVAHETARDFIDKVLVERLGATHVSVGENFGFGHRAVGTPAMLAADPRFETRVVPMVSRGGETVSSTRIRGLIAAGDVEQAGELLGAPFRIRGTVVPGDQRGRDLGFPTANIKPDPRLIQPAHGVYACRVGERAAAVNVGVRPTFGEDLALTVEAFVLDFEGDLYGQALTVEFIARLRGETRFDNVDDLISQMRSDVQRTRELLA